MLYILLFLWWLSSFGCVLVCACLVVVDWICGCHIVVCVDTTNNFTTTASTCLGYLLLFILFCVFIGLRVSSCFHAVFNVKLVVVDRFCGCIRERGQELVYKCQCSYLFPCFCVILLSCCVGQVIFLWLLWSN